MDIQVKAEAPKNDEMKATLTIPAKDVDAAIARVYKEIANKYKFQGFRQGKAPRPVIDSMIGKPAVMADATNEVMAAAEPLLFHELNVVPMGDPTYGEKDKEVSSVEAGKDYTLAVTIPLRPDYKLSDYNPVKIQMPPAKATQAEIDQQTEALLSLQANMHAMKEQTQAKKGPGEIADKGESEKAEKGASEKAGAPKAADKKAAPKLSKLTDELAKEAFGFESAAAFTEAITKEIQQDKDANLGRLKEARALEALTKRLGDKKVPEAYAEEVFQENARAFMNNLQAQGQTVDSFLQMRGLKMEQLLDDMHKQAEEQALQSLALDSLAKELKINPTDDDVKEEFASVYKDPKDMKRAMDEFLKSGRLPSIREAIKRQRALKWLVDKAEVEEVDEIAEQRKEKKDN